MSNKILGLIVMIMLTQPFMFSAQDASGELMKRSEIDPKYTWNLEDIYKSLDDWNADYNWVEQNIPKYSEFKGKVGKSAEDLLAVIKFDEEIDIKLGKLALYASLAHDLDLGDAKYQVLYNRVNDLKAKASSESAFIVPEILQIPEDKLWAYVNEEPQLKIYKHFFENLLRSKKHILSPKEERILALASPIEDVPYNTFSLLKNVEAQFPTIKDESGEHDIQISDGRYYAALYSTNRDYRERAYKAYYKPFMEYKNTFNSLLNGAIKVNIFNAKARNYSSALEAALAPNNIPVSVYNNLIETVNKNLETLHRWAALKKKVLKYKELHAYDTYVTLFPEAKHEYTYDDAVKLVLDALKPLGEDYIKNLKYAFEHRWIDVYETKGKRSGAYSSDRGYGVHPYVLLNWNNQLNDVFTLAHEMGHNMHSHYSGTNQPYVYSDYSIFVAEVASTMNEALLLDYLIEHAKNKNEKLALIEKNLDNITFTFFRQTRFAEFEKAIHEKTEAGESLTPDAMCKLYGEMYQKYWGPEMVVDKEETYTWARIPHFYYNFYVYQYATSFAASQALEAKVKKEGKPAVEKYLNFLKSGSSDYPIEVLKKAGVDMTSPDAINAVISKMNKLMDEMEKELDE
jgi:oligoendopeptidase F